MAASSSVVTEAKPVTQDKLFGVFYGSREMRTRKNLINLQLARNISPLKQTLFSHVIIDLAYRFMHISSSAKRMTKGEDDVLIGGKCSANSAKGQKVPEAELTAAPLLPNCNIPFIPDLKGIGCVRTPAATDASQGVESHEGRIRVGLCIPLTAQLIIGACKAIKFSWIYPYAGGR